VVYTRVVNKRQNHSLIKRIAIDIGGFGLILLGLLTGWLPGPGGIPLVLAGLALLSLNYEWAERILKDFDRKRIEYTERYLNADPRTARIIDVLCLAMIVGGSWLLYTQTSLTPKALGAGLILLGIVTIASNQKRFSKLVKRLKKNKR
jgi:hypothetical protein